MLFGGSGHGFPLGKAATALLIKENDIAEAKIGTPYLSGAGLDIFGSAITGTRWASIKTSWLIGIHHGVTEPAALRKLIAFPNSDSRIFLISGSVSEKELRSRPIFHAKIVAFERAIGTSIAITAAVVSSANLTSAALGQSNSGTNFEAGAAISVEDPKVRLAWKSWWSDAWAHGAPLDERLVQRYELVREKFIRTNPTILDLVDPPSSTLVTGAPTLWIEAGAMSGGSRNQVEFNSALAAFFGPVTQSQIILSIRSGSQTWIDRPLSYKITTFGLAIWRLSFPTPASSGLTYHDQIICLRKDESVPGLFHLSVATPGSTLALRWRAESGRHGYVGKTSGNREFGLS